MYSPIRIIIILLLFLCFTSDSYAGWSVKEIRKEKLVVEAIRHSMNGGYKVIRSDEVKSWMDQKKDMLIINTMKGLSAVIPGSLTFGLPAKQITELTEEQQKKFLSILGPDKNRCIVFYCGFTECMRSHTGALLASKLGYTDVYRCPGGIKAWNENDFPTEIVQ